MILYRVGGRPEESQPETDEHALCVERGGVHPKRVMPRR
jgi:hypothetical protein